MASYMLFPFGRFVEKVIVADMMDESNPLLSPMLESGIPSSDGSRRNSIEMITSFSDNGLNENSSG